MNGHRRYVACSAATLGLISGCGGSDQQRAATEAAPPQTELELPGGTLQSATVAPLADGAALVGVSYDQPTADGYSCDRITPEQAVVARFAAGRFVARQPMNESLDGLAAGGGRAALATTRAIGVTGDCTELSRLTLRAGPVDRPGAEVRVLAERAQLAGTSLAVDDQGTVALAWSQILRRNSGTSRERLWLTTWPAGGEPGRARLLAQARSEAYVGGNAFDGLTLKPRPGGGWLVVTRRSARPSMVVADELRPDGSRTTTPLGPARDLTDLSVATSRSGRVAVVWGSQDGGEERNEPYRVHAALREAGARRFARSQQLDAGGWKEDGPPGRPAVDFATDGTAMAVWANRSTDRTAYVALARARSGDGFVRGRMVPRRSLEGFAAGPGGRSTILLAQGDMVTALLAPSDRTIALPFRAAVLDIAYLPGEASAVALVEVAGSDRLTAELVRVG